MHRFIRLHRRMAGSGLLFMGVAVVTFYFTGFLQTSLHLLLGHRRTGLWLFQNHVRFHHSIYSKKTVMTSARYLDEDRSNTGFYLVPIVFALAISYPLLPLDIFGVFAATMFLTYVAHIYVHVHFHLTSSWLQRFNWFLRLQRLHVVHHVDMRKNHAVLMPFWDRVLGTYQSAVRRQAIPAKTPRGPTSSWLTGNLPDLQGDKLAFALKCDRESDGIVQLRLWNQPFFMVSDATLIGEVLVNQHKNFTKPMPLKALSVAFGRGLLTSEQDLWRHERQLIQPAFHKARLDRQLSTARACVTRMLDGWADGAVRDVYPDIATVCLEVFTQTIFGEALREDERQTVIDGVARVQECSRAFSCLPKERLPFPSTLRLHQACRRLDAVVRDLVERKRDRSDGDDMISLLLRANASGDPVVTLEQIRDELITMWMAGFETVASGVAWALYLLSEHPSAAAKLEHELDDVMQGRPIEVDDIPRLKWLGKIVKEAHRLYPPVYQIGRVAIESCEIGGHTIPANTHVLMYAWAVQRSPRYYEDPDAFRPERWTEEMTRALPTFAYIPFGGGPRKCIGHALSTVETALLIGTIAQAWRLTLVPGARVVPDPALSLPIAGNSLPMMAHRREMRQRRSARVIEQPISRGCPFAKSA